ncbi:MAG: hypothetical protein LBN29_04140 [Mediterranea sp.]|jgi:hypothetical protein|nr:hypothetical protein [Mediterranea sp.]
MKKIVIAILCIASMYILHGCSHEFLVGKYVAKSGVHELRFYPDSTFRYEYYGGCYKEATGYWRRDGKQLCLRSLGQIDKVPIIYQKHAGNSSDTSVINIAINMPDEEIGNYSSLPVLNLRYATTLRSRGSFSFKYVKRVDSLALILEKVPFSGDGYGWKACFNKLRSETIYPDLSVGDTLSVQVNIIDSLFSYQVFKDKPIKIGHKSLVFKDGKKRYRLRLDNNSDIELKDEESYAH